MFAARHMQVKLVTSALNEHYIQRDVCPSLTATEVVCNNTAGQLPLRCLFVDMFASADTTRRVCGHKAISRSFLSDILIKKVILEQEYPDDVMARVFDRDFLSSQRRCDHIYCTVSSTQRAATAAWRRTKRLNMTEMSNLARVLEFAIFMQVC
jgi:hypothetical protein